MGRRPKNYVTPPDVLLIECVRCAKTKEETNFYASKWSRVFNVNKKFVPLCKDCVNLLLEEYTKRFDEKTALCILCANLDLPFLPELYTRLVNDNSCFSFGRYVRQLQLRNYHDLNFQVSITSGELLKTSGQAAEAAASKWSREDKQNRNYALSTVGYDPFDSGNMTDDDRKYCFNILSGYCDIEGIKEDGHKMVCCIQIVQSQLQIKKINEEINQELLSGNFDESKIKKLTDSKRILQDGIMKLAQENGISSKDGEKRGNNALTQKMKKMQEDGFEPVRPNLFDIETSESILQTARISAQSIAEQIGFDDNDYALMVKEQREKIQKMRETNEYLEEENRNLKNELADLKNNSKKRGGG